MLQPSKNHYQEASRPPSMLLSMPKDNYSLMAEQGP